MDEAPECNFHRLELGYLKCAHFEENYVDILLDHNRLSVWLITDKNFDKKEVNSIREAERVFEEFERRLINGS